MQHHPDAVEPLIDFSRGFSSSSRRTSLSSAFRALDPATTRLVASTPLGGPTDYVHYVASTREIMAVSPTGALSLLGTVPTADRAFSVAADDRGHAWVIDPDHGQLLRITDPFPKGGG